MAVHIRMQKKGKTHKPFFQIVAADHRKPQNGRFLEKLGYYDPSTSPSTIELNPERVSYWYENGAQVSEQVQKFCKIKGVNLFRKKIERKAKGE